MSSTTHSLNSERLGEVVEALRKALSRDELRSLSQRAVQAKIWHLEPLVASYLSDLRSAEEVIRSEIFTKFSSLIFQLHEYTLDVTLARAGITLDLRVDGSSSLDQVTGEVLDLFCLDAKERLYLILKQYEWLGDFFRRFPIHFYENSFQFVDRIPSKKLPVKVKVIGLGIGGSLAVSGLARAKIDSVVGYEKRSRGGHNGVTSRYQNASWRAYDIAKKLLDDESYQTLVRYQQRVNMTRPDGTKTVVTTDRVQIIIGAAISAALDSAERYGAQLRFDCSLSDYCASEDMTTDDAVHQDADIVALFAGAHTADLVPGLRDEMKVISWPDLTSKCRMWLQIKESERKEAYTARGGEIGAERWHYTIESSRETVDDIQRIRGNLLAQLDRNKNDKGKITCIERQLEKLHNTLEFIESSGVGARFDYVFTNAPDNEHNRSKREFVGKDGHVVLDGGYQVDPKIACQNAFDSSSTSSIFLLSRFRTETIVTGGDACVPPNPLAAYGATLACEAAEMLVQLAVAHGHLNAILLKMPGLTDDKYFSWSNSLKELKYLFTKYYNARSQSENYFQLVQTLICNLYSLPPMR